MLELRPNCEYCDIDLPADSENACICSYECTFCRDCVDNILTNVCPNCGGGFTSRPIRPQRDHRSGVSLQHQSASTKPVHTKFSEEDIRAFAANIAAIDPQQR